MYLIKTDSEITAKSNKSLLFATLCPSCSHNHPGYSHSAKTNFQVAAEIPYWLPKVLHKHLRHYKYFAYLARSDAVAGATAKATSVKATSTHASATDEPDRPRAYPGYIASSLHMFRTMVFRNSTGKTKIQSNSLRFRKFETFNTGFRNR